MIEHTQTPWHQDNLNWRNEPDEFRRYIHGDLHEDDEGSSAVAVAMVEGNATSHSVTEANARRIVLAVNAVAGVPDELLESMAATALLARLCALERAAEEVMAQFDTRRPKKEDTVLLLGLLDGAFRKALDAVRLDRK